MTTDAALLGIHHVTAIAGDPQQNVDFYMGVLGLRLVKKTVNFDDPQSYHLYYGDALGHPGTVMTFFAWPGAPRGQIEAGQIGVTAFSIPATALPFWEDRLAAGQGRVMATEARFGDQVLRFSDPDGLPLELIATRMPDGRPGWNDGPIPVAYAIRGFHAPTLYVGQMEASARLLTDVMGCRVVADEGSRVRFGMADAAPGCLVDLVARTGGPRGRLGAGTVHHMAWRTPDAAHQLAWHDELAGRGIDVTDVRDRQYFRSIYYHEPSGILYEIATDQPGFAVDEEPGALGSGLKLPPWLEPSRAQLERVLPPIQLPPVMNEAAR